MSKIEHELTEARSKDDDLTKTMSQIIAKMDAYIEELKDLTVKIHIQNNRVLMLNNPVLHDKIEEVMLKVCQIAA